MKIALAGTGAMGVIHVKALNKIAGVEVVAIASRTEESGKAFAGEWKIPFHSTSLEACIDRPGVDAVILTTPSDQHADQTVLYPKGPVTRGGLTERYLGDYANMGEAIPLPRYQQHTCIAADVVQWQGDRHAGKYHGVV